MRVVIDTNVLVSGVFFGGNPGRVLDAWRDGRIDLVVSSEILEEYRRVGEELEIRFPGVSFAPFLALVAMHARVVEPLELTEGVAADPDDDKFFACALAADCRLIISGDKHVLAASGYRSIKVAKPRDFVDSLGPRSGQ
jgi:putative PIN family toxin of toxin-antitoxin system